MENAFYATLTRQSGLLREMQSVAHNIANLSTTGYRGDGVIFSEYVSQGAHGDSSLSMATADIRKIDLRQGAIVPTGGTFDFAIEGDGFFLIETPDGQRLTRAGSFSPNAVGELSTPDGHRLLDAGGAPVFIPPDAEGVTMSADGTISANGRALTQIGVWAPVEAAEMTRETGTLFMTSGEIEPVFEGTALLQGYVENSNVEPVWEMARMVEVQRAYELGQSFIEKEEERLREMMRAVFK